jgi:hypothetical protein
MCEKTRMYNGKYVIELNLIRVWFGMILALIKKEEYRSLESKTFQKQFKCIDGIYRVKVPYKKEYAMPDECVILFCN